MTQRVGQLTFMTEKKLGDLLGYKLKSHYTIGYQMIENYYDQWNDIKKNISKKSKDINFNEKEIFMSYIGYNIGFEQNGSNKRGGFKIVVDKFKKLTDVTPGRLKGSG